MGGNVGADAHTKVALFAPVHSMTRETLSHILRRRGLNPLPGGGGHSIDGSSLREVLQGMSCEWQQLISF